MGGASLGKGAFAKAGFMEMDRFWTDAEASVEFGYKSRARFFLSRGTQFSRTRVLLSRVIGTADTPASYSVSLRGCGIFARYMARLSVRSVW